MRRPASRLLLVCASLTSIVLAACTDRNPASAHAPYSPRRRPRWWR